VPLPPPSQSQTAAFSHPLEAPDTTAPDPRGRSKSPQKQHIDRTPQQKPKSTYQPQYPPQQQQQQQQQQHPLQNLPPPPMTQQHAPPPTKYPQTQTHLRQQSPSTPDQEVDAFLLGDTDAPASRKLRPSPLSASQSKLEKVKTLAQSRAWGDVLRMTQEVLHGAVGDDDESTSSGIGKSPYARCYAELLAVAEGTKSAHPRTSTGDAPDTKELNMERIKRETSEFIALRLVGLLKLRRYVDLGREVESLGLMPHLPDRYPVASDGEAHDMPEPPLAWKEGSLHPTDLTADTLPAWVPFGLRIMAAHQLQYNDGSSRAIDVLYDLRDRCVRTEYWDTAGMEMWRPVIDNALVNAFVRKREWKMALRSLDDLMAGLDEGVNREVEWWCNKDWHGGGPNIVSEVERSQMRQLILPACRVEILSRQLLILLQSGAVPAAETIQKSVRLQVAELQSCQERNRRITSGTATIFGRAARELDLVRAAPHRQMVNDGLLRFARGEHTEAAKCFQDAMTAQRLDVVTSSSASSSATILRTGCPTYKELTNPTIGFSTEHSLLVECLNNLSLCLLYSGSMRTSVAELENWIREDPCQYLTEGVVFNVCTLYELGSEGEACTRRKKLLQRVAKRFYLHDVGVESFRLG